MDWIDEKGRVWVEGDCYVLPAGWTWARIVAERRTPIQVPLANVAGIVAWGTFLPSDVVSNMCAASD